ncbi:MAG TPA: hypothetical protein VM536_15750 [Chloroflexia bacterium]|nr:hypothetical protein [Chloroflexia bacterium]
MLQTPENRGAVPAGGTPGGSVLVTTGAIVAAILVVIVIGFALSRSYLAAFNAKPISMATGPAARTVNQANNWRVKIGPTRMRLGSPAQLEAFQPGVAYRVYYLSGPVANVLSAEVFTGEPGAVDAAGEAEDGTADDPTVQIARGARLVILLLGVLALEIPVAALWSGTLPVSARWLVISVLLLQALGFVWFALWRLRRP